MYLVSLYIRCANNPVQNSRFGKLTVIMWKLSHGVHRGLSVVSFGILAEEAESRDGKKNGMGEKDG